MAFDLLWRKLSVRNFGRDVVLTAAPAPPAANVLEEALRRVAAPVPGFSIEKRGRGAVVSRRWRW
jgi:hypothetical protein